jgi:Domain of unknown function (DUF1707)
MVSDYQMRVSDTEREAAAAELREHYAAGRLTLEELNERLDKTYAAKTRGDLNALMTDLPSSRWSAGSGPAASAYGPRQVGTGAGRDWRTGSDWSRGTAGRGAGHTIAALMSSFVLLSALLLLGILGVFGIGTGRPIGIILILAALALLRRLLFRRRAGTARGCGPRGRRW